MTVNFSLRAATWIFSQLAPREESEAMVGDLFEEFTLRTTTGSASIAARWCLQQIISSTPALLLAGFRRGAWTPALIAAVLGFAGVVASNFIVGWAIMRGPAPIRSLGMIPFSLIVVLIVYFAARYRRSAAVILGVLITIATAATVQRGGPMWRQITWLVLGPTATFIGCALQSLRRPR
ncbi:MAG TPA: hypothetical protein VGM97_15845 [Steroidobacteraceae bacterium]|jgi:hypothetical protein